MQFPKPKEWLEMAQMQYGEGWGYCEEGEIGAGRPNIQEKTLAKNSKRRYDADTEINKEKYSEKQHQQYQKRPPGTLSTKSKRILEDHFGLDSDRD
jgi:hypothetical protein